MFSNHAQKHHLLTSRLFYERADHARLSLRTTVWAAVDLTFWMEWRDF